MARRGPRIQLKLKLVQKRNLGKKSPISWFDREREREREREKKRERGEPKASFQDLRSSVSRFSLGQEQKFISSTRGTCGYLKRGISPKIQEGRFWEIEVVGFRRLPTRVSRS